MIYILNDNVIVLLLFEFAELKTFMYIIYVIIHYNILKL